MHGTNNFKGGKICLVHAFGPCPLVWHVVMENIRGQGHKRKAVRLLVASQPKEKGRCLEQDMSLNAGPLS